MSIARGYRATGFSDRLGNLATFYHREARKYSRARAYLAASAMQGAASGSCVTGNEAC
jgi:hypothetical protein